MFTKRDTGTSGTRRSTITYLQKCYQFMCMHHLRQLRTRQQRENERVKDDQDIKKLRDKYETNETDSMTSNQEENEFLEQQPGFASMAIHVGQDPERWKSLAIVPPIFTSSTFKQYAPGVWGDKGYEYGRTGNPTKSVLEEILAALENGKYGLTFPSGLGASTAIMFLLSNGDHILSSYDLYGGTCRLLRQVVSRMGIETTFTDFTDLDKVKCAIKENTKMIWFETPTNPLLKVIDIAAISKLAKDYNKEILIVVDNTFLTSYHQKPLNFGADIVMYSLSKYMNGHYDVIMGAAIVNDVELRKKLRFLQISMGVVPSPMDCYLMIRGLKTLALRMEHHKKSSIKLAQWLLQHPKITEVIHPGLPSHPQYDIAKKQMTGHSGVFSFRHSGGLDESRKFLGSLKMFTLAVSFGGFRSLAELPTLMTHASLSPKELAELNITDSLIRISVGLEDTVDLIKDLEQGLDVAFN